MPDIKAKKIRTMKNVFDFSVNEFMFLTKINGLLNRYVGAKKHISVEC